MKIKRIGQLCMLIFFLILVGSRQTSAVSTEEWLIKESKSQNNWQEKKIKMQKNVYPGMVLSQRKWRIKNESGQKMKLFLSVQSKSDEMDWLLSEVFFSKNDQEVKTRFQMDGVDQRISEFTLSNDEEATVEISCTVNGELAQNRHQGQAFQVCWEFIATAENSQQLPHAGESIESGRTVFLGMAIIFSSLLWKSVGIKMIEEKIVKKVE